MLPSAIKSLGHIEREWSRASATYLHTCLSLRPCHGRRGGEGERERNAQLYSRKKSRALALLFSFDRQGTVSEGGKSHMINACMLHVFNFFIAVFRVGGVNLNMDQCAMKMTFHKLTPHKVHVRDLRHSSFPVLSNLIEICHTCFSDAYNSMNAWNQWLYVVCCCW